MVLYVKYKVTAFAISLASLLTIAYISPRTMLELLAYTSLLLYTSWGAYHIILLYSGTRVKKDENAINNNNVIYPKISIIIPVRAEPILSRTIEATLLHNSYPMERKEIVVVTEDEDMARIALYYQHKYPENVKVLLRRSYFPTKPSALNDALALCTGDIIGVVDAEDILEHDLLHKVVYAIYSKGYDVVQARLMISNANDSWISKIFAMEYAGWFSVWLTGRAALRLYTPLGGTGNYLKRSALQEVGLWDPLNLAEDAELAIRLLLAGKRIGVIDARQWEEAPVTFKAWLKQRSRWYRGWLQSLYKYTPVLVRVSTIKRIGIANTIATFYMLISPLVVAFNYIAYMLTILWILEYIYYLTWFKGARLEGIRYSIKDIPYTFIYMNIMMPLAAYRALYQCIFKDVFWEKTRHEGRGVKWVYDVQQHAR
jgi:cellulose synthase/poly-beta-1,6-N-acetylglucosamine synthase-like glycosyltransferase